VKPCPDRSRLPVAEPAPAGHAGTAAHLLWQLRPGYAGAQHEDDAFEYLAVIEGRTAALWPQRLLGEQRCYQRPERVGDQRFSHPLRLACSRHTGEVSLRALKGCYVHERALPGTNAKCNGGTAVIDVTSTSAIRRLTSVIFSFVL
jgi:hypothetical protein